MFNLSHSGDSALVGLALSDIGVDVEVVRALPDRDEIARRNFARTEADALEGLPAADRHDGFFACWTRKEAFLKALGVGLGDGLAHFEVSVDPHAPAALRAIGGDREAAGGWSMWSGRTGPDDRAAAAVRGAGVRFDLFNLDHAALSSD